MTGPLCLPPADWPVVDQKRWRDARVVTSFLAGAQPAQTWSSRRCRIVEQAYGQWLSFLRRSGQLDPQELPEDRATLQRIAAFVATLQERVAPWSTVMMVQGVQRMLSVMAPGRDWHWLASAVSNLKRLAKPSRDRLSHMVSPRQLYRLGLDLMERAGNEAAEGRYHAATVGRDGLMIALLACCPIRIANLTAIEIGRHLIADGRCYRLVFEEKEVKTGRPFDGELPPELSPYVDDYLRIHRRQLITRGRGEPTRRLWIDRWGEPMREASIRTQIEKRSRDAFGRHVWPHLFRAIAATGFVDHAPEQASLLPDLLGHADPQTAHRYYVLSTGALAQRAVQSSVARRRAAAAARLGRSRKGRNGS